MVVYKVNNNEGLLVGWGFGCESVVVGGVFTWLSTSNLLTHLPFKPWLVLVVDILL